MTTQDQGPMQADTTPDPTSSQDTPPTAEAAAAKVFRAPNGSYIVSLLALALAFFAAATAGFLWWQYREFYVALDRADGEIDVSVRGVRAGLRALEDRLGPLGERDADLARAIEQAVARVNANAARFADLDQRLGALQGVSADARDRWLRAQAEYFLGIANAEISLRANRNNAIAALELADQALLDAGSPVYSGVRERIADELVALRGTGAPDLEGLSYSLSRLAARVTDLPMRAPSAETEPFAPPANDAEPGLGRLWQSFKNALTGMVRIERNDTTAVYALSRNQQMLVRRQLELELTLARLALVQAMPELFVTSIVNARTLLQQHFETDTTAVEGALALLEEMQALEVAPRYPDISGSLALLRDLPDREN
jgi:uroporphyrin-3 C-methyltransferase